MATSMADRIILAISLVGLVGLGIVSAYQRGLADAPPKVKIVNHYSAERFCATLSPTELRRMASAKQRMEQVK